AVAASHVVAGELRYVGKETDRKWEEGDDLSVLEFKNTEYGRSKRVVAGEEVQKEIKRIGIKKCAREIGFTRIFIRKLLRGGTVKRNSYDEFVRCLQGYKIQNKHNLPAFVLDQITARPKPLIPKAPEQSTDIPTIT